jgi:hypothetical protein
MREVAEREIREVGGHRQITAPTYEPPFWLNYKNVVHKVLFDYLPTDADERVAQERIRLIIAAQYLWAGRTAKETSEYLAERGYSLTENAVCLAAHKLSRRAEKICEQLGIHPPTETDKRPRFDRHQFERRFRKTTSRTPAVGRGRLIGIVDVAVVMPGEREKLSKQELLLRVKAAEEATETIAFYKQLSNSVLLELGAVSPGDQVIERELFVPFLRSQQIFYCSDRSLQRKPERFCATTVS